MDQDVRSRTQEILTDTCANEHPEALSEAFCSSEGSDIEVFLPVFNTIDLNALEAVALKVRQSRDQAQSSCVTNEQDLLLSCKVLTPPRTGSYSIAYLVEFSDGVKWIAHVPGSGVDSFEALEAQNFISNIRTMSFIQSSTSIPIPEVFSWKATKDNPVKVPYRLESFVEGTSLSEKWTDSSWTTECKRLKLIRNLAIIMAQLHDLRFEQIGGLHFDDLGEFSHIRERVYIKQNYDKVMSGEEVWGTACTSQPFNTTKACLLEAIEDPEIPERAQYVRADFELLRLVIESIPESLETNAAFALGHPDFNYQNIFIDDDCNITGIIDWDGASTHCRALRFARYPSWITRDWDPVRYGYGLEDGEKEDSPEQLLSYRKEYAATFADFHLPASHYSPNDTKLAQILEAIAIATSDGICRDWILMKLLQWAFNDKLPFELTMMRRPDEFYIGRPVSREWMDAIHEFRCLYLIGEANDWIEAIKEAFAEMWHPEWED